ncbi:MAG: phosphate ABC transporter permease subunit PstC [Candidatus Hydrogenedens sp.]|nr:phosphate ABC transporter permease subunit PstC [Candidatus Hydrogenedens sp.]
MRWTFTAMASVTILIVLAIFLFLFKESLIFLREEGIMPLLSTRWSPTSVQEPGFGVLPLVTGSILVTLLAGVVAVPLGIAGAVYIAEVARPLEREILKPFIELLAGIPSVVLGFFGLVVVVPAVKAAFGLSSGMNALSGAAVLGLMAIPTIISVSEDALRAVPASYRNASLALGASHQQTVWRVLVPAAIPGITAAVMLGFGRIVGETMAVMMVTGNAAKMTFVPTDSVRTMTATIAAEMGEVAQGSVHYSALFCVGVLLFFATFLLNLLALNVFKRYGGRA